MNFASRRYTVATQVRACSIFIPKAFALWTEWQITAVFDMARCRKPVAMNGKDDHTFVIVQNPLIQLFYRESPQLAGVSTGLKQPHFHRRRSHEELRAIGGEAVLTL